MTTFANESISSNPACLAPAEQRGSVREMLSAFARRMTWLKPPYRTALACSAWLYSTRNLLRAEQITRVQVGCGKDVREGWWNVDMIHFPGVDEIRNATLPWRHRNLRYVFAEHFIEHLTLLEGMAFLRHAGNALGSGGLIRLSTPNLSHVILQNYQLHGATPARRLNDTLSLNASFHGYGHRFLYSEEFLRFMLEEMGFENVRECAFGESEDPNLRGLERHGPYHVDEGIRNLVILEASRGERPIGPSPALQSFLHQYFDGDIYR